MLGIGYVKTL